MAREAKHFLTKPLHWGIQPREQLQKQEPYLQMHRTQSRKELGSNPQMFLGELSTTSNSTTKKRGQDSMSRDFVAKIFKDMQMLMQYSGRHNVLKLFLILRTTTYVLFFLYNMDIPIRAISQSQLHAAQLIFPHCTS